VSGSATTASDGKNQASCSLHIVWLFAIRFVLQRGEVLSGDLIRWANSSLYWRGRSARGSNFQARPDALPSGASLACFAGCLYLGDNWENSITHCSDSAFLVCLVL